VTGGASGYTREVTPGIDAAHFVVASQKSKGICIPYLETMFHLLAVTNSLIELIFVDRR
jgi:hypothetical protein